MTVRNMSLRDLETVLDWAAAEGWNPGMDDAAAFFAADPKGFFVAEKDGRLAAAISVVNHSDRFAFLGLYICLPEFRGRGIGFALWEHALRHAGERTIGLDGVPDQQANYRRSGFERASETARFEGAVSPVANTALRPARESDLPALKANCFSANGYRMDAFLSAWFQPTANRQTLVWDGGSGPTGFATWRRCRDGIKIGPLVADRLYVATNILHAIAAAHPGETFVIDVPRDMGALADHCRSEGMVCSFSTARMYRGPQPVTGDAIRTIATLELG